MTKDSEIGQIVLVTGAAGRVGREVVRLLSAQRVPVRAAVEDMGRAYGQDWYGAALASFRYNQPAMYPAVFAGVNRLLLVMPPGDVQSQAGEIAALIDYARGAGVEHIVFISTLGTERLHITAQWAVEQHLIRSGVAYTILRSGWFYQNFLTDPLLFEDVRQGLLRLPYGDSVRVNGVDVRDVAAVAVVAFTQPQHRGQIYALGEQAMCPPEIAEEFSRALGRPIRLVRISEHEAAHVLRARGVDRQVAKWWRIFYQLMQQGAYAECVPDVSRVLGRPAITFGEFVAEHAAAWKAPGE